MSVAQPFVDLLDQYPADPWAKAAYFSREDLACLEQARRAVRPDRRTVVYAVFENPFGNAGGIWKVAEHLPFAIREAGNKVLVVSPFHSKLKGAKAANLRDVGTVGVAFGRGSKRRTVPVKLREFYLKHDELGGPLFVDEAEQDSAVRWVLLDADDFFNAAGGLGNNNPYDHTSPDEPEIDTNRRLACDSLFLSAAIPEALAALGLTEDLVIHAQDWQLAATGLTIKQAILNGRLKSAAAVLTMHNPYDCWLPRAFLSRITDRWQRPYWRLHDDDVPEETVEPETLPDVDKEAEELERRPAPAKRRITFYQCMLPLFDAPISTVSCGFAAELTTHPLQKVHFADHLQAIFRTQGVLGVNNGLFEKPKRPYPSEVVEQAMAGNPQPILQQKLLKRKKMLSILPKYWAKKPWGSLRGVETEPATLPENVPVFMMFGRMDPGQKGFDVLANAIRKISFGKARFLLMPAGIPQDSGFVDDLRQLAEDRAGDVVVYPFRMSPEDYLATMAGATFCVMPSLYEPFGAATEPYLQGTPVVARATGGLLQQVADVHEDRATATGILARDDYPPDAEDLGAMWKEIQESESPTLRMENELYEAIVDGVADALEQAIAIFRFEQDVYSTMLAHLYRKAVEFSWDKAAKEYGHIYDVACR